MKSITNNCYNETVLAPGREATPEMEKAESEFRKLLSEVEKKGEIPQPDDFMNLFKTGLDARGINYHSKEFIEKMEEGYLQPLMDELAEKDRELTEKIRKVFISAGVPKNQLEQTDLNKVYLTEKQKNQLDKLCQKKDEVGIEMYYVGGMACVLNEEREKLEKAEG